MKQQTKVPANVQKLSIPGIKDILIFPGAVPSTGGTASIEVITREFAKAAKEGIIPPPPELSLNI